MRKCLYLTFFPIIFQRNCSKEAGHIFLRRMSVVEFFLQIIFTNFKAAVILSLLWGAKAELRYF